MARICFIASPMDIFSESYIYDIAYIMCSGLLTRQSSHSNTLEMAANSNQSLTAGKKDSLLKYSCH